MILKGNQRGGGGKMAAHLSNTLENDHVELHEIRGLASQDMAGAFQEIEAVSRGTKCQQPFFSVSLNPPAGYAANFDQFDMALEAIEAKYPDLAQQPRVVVFHEKEGRRHAHAIWSRIDGERMRAIPLPFTRERLREASRDLFQHMGLEAPAGLRDRQQRDPRNYGPAIWQQAKRLSEDPRDLKATMRAAWTRSDSRASFEHALEQQGFLLARGDRRGFVAVHHSGEALSLSRYAGVKAKELTARLGQPGQVRTLDQARGVIRDRMTASHENRMANLKHQQARQMRPLRDQAAAMKKAHQAERQTLKTAQAERQGREGLTRGQRIRKGIAGLWDRLTGKRGKVSELNAKEATAGRVRDRDERQTQIDRQRGQRAELQKGIVQMRGRHHQERQGQRAELAEMLATTRDQGREAGRDQDQEQDATQDQDRDQERKALWQAQDRSRGGRSKRGKDGPELER